MPIYRYRVKGTDIERLNSLLPNHSVSMRSLTPRVLVDLEAEVADKENIDEIMTTCGYAFVETDPANEESTDIKTFLDNTGIVLDSASGLKGRFTDIEAMRATRELTNSSSNPIHCNSFTPLKTDGPLHIYVRDDIGDDANSGTIAAPVKTVEEAISRIPLIVNHSVFVHLGSHPGAGWGYPRFEKSRTLNANIYIIGDGAGEPGVDGFTEIVSSTAALAGSNINTVKGAGMTPGDYDGYTLEILTGAAAGDRRTIRNNTVTDIVSARGFSAAVSAADLYRILRPSIKINFLSPDTNDVMLENTGSGDDRIFSVMYFYNKTHSVWLINVGLVDTLFSYVAISMVRSCLTLMGVEFDCSSPHIEIDRSTLKMGVEGYYDPTYSGGVPSAVDDFGAPSPLSWAGWGAFTRGSAASLASFTGGHIYGVFCSTMLVTPANTKWWLSGGHLALGCGVVRESYPDTHIILYDEPFTSSAAVLLGNNAGLSGITACVQMGSGFAEVANCALYGDGDGLVAQQFGTIHESLSTGTVGGYGVLTRWNGQVYYDHQPKIVGGLGDLSVNNGRTAHSRTLLTDVHTALVDKIHGKIFRNDNT
ncbi:MAG: hypothetical protein ACE5F6_00275 [Anaerolineae bacterium]